MSKKKLTLKQQKFADEYIITGNIYQSAVNAGYSKAYARGNASKLMENVSIKTYIDDRLEEIKTEKIADQQEVMEYLASVLRGQITDEVLMVVGDGDFGSNVEKHEKRSDTSDRTKAAELIGKRYTMWTEKQQVENITPTFVEDVPEDD
ncbi:terminase small subunit [Virgibacillus salexigens]|uniref:terminase small subunit n=1 Tax=Virgibacillus salexigens TaxID=61016 RepID=UPI00190DB453|nr:terminase small subunit [Virgibacillus salexigens]